MFHYYAFGNKVNSYLHFRDASAAKDAFKRGAFSVKITKGSLMPPKPTCLLSSLHVYEVKGGQGKAELGIYH